MIILRRGRITTHWPAAVTGCGLAVPVAVLAISFFEGSQNEEVSRGCCGHLALAKGNQAKTLEIPPNNFTICSHIFTLIYMGHSTPNRSLLNPIPFDLVEIFICY